MATQSSHIPEQFQDFNKTEEETLEQAVQNRSVSIETKTLYEGVEIPTLKHLGDAAYDVAAYVPKNLDVLGRDPEFLKQMRIKQCFNQKKSQFIIPPGSMCAIPTGLAIAIPRHWKLSLRPRSGLSIKHGITLANSPATIDSGYRDEVFLLIQNHHKNEPFEIKNGDRLAQALIEPIFYINFVEVESLSSSKRGKNGLGSTGINKKS